MTFLEWLSRVGNKAAAKRLNVTVRTVQRWKRQGVSARSTERVEKIVRRSTAAKKAAITRRASAQRSTGLEAPPESELSDEEVLPARLPGNREKDAAYKSEGSTVESGWESIETRYSVGWVRWVTIGKSILDVSVDELYDVAIESWHKIRPPREYVAVKLLLFRYIPFNPIYKGEMVKKQGTWVEKWVSSKAVSTSRRLKDYIEGMLEYTQRWAETRIIFLESMGVQMFDRIHEQS